MAFDKLETGDYLTKELVNKQSQNIKKLSEDNNLLLSDSNYNNLADSLMTSHFNHTGKLTGNSLKLTSIKVKLKTYNEGIYAFISEDEGEVQNIAIDDLGQKLCDNFTIIKNKLYIVSYDGSKFKNVKLGLDKHDIAVKYPVYKPPKITDTTTVDIANNISFSAPQPLYVQDYLAKVHVKAVDGNTVVNNSFDVANVLPTKIYNDLGLTSPKTWTFQVSYENKDGKKSPYGDEVVLALTGANLYKPTVASASALKNGSRNVGKTPTLTMNPPTASAIITHIKTRWQVSITNTFATADIKTDTTVDSADLVETFNLDENTQYYIRVRMEAQTYGWSPWSDTIEFTTGLLHAPQWKTAQPTGKLTLTPTLEFASLTLPTGTPDQIGEWLQIWETTGSKSKVYDTGQLNTKTNKITIPSGNLARNTVYEVRFRQKDRTNGWTAWTEGSTFYITTANVYPAVPTLKAGLDFTNAVKSTVAGVSNAVGRGFDVEFNAFSVVNASPSETYTHSKTQIRISEKSDFSTTIYDVTFSSSDALLGSLIVLNNAVVNTVYYFDARFEEVSLGWGEWVSESGVTMVFKTLTSFPYHPRYSVDKGVSYSFPTRHGGNVEMFHLGGNNYAVIRYSPNYSSSQYTASVSYTEVEITDSAITEKYKITYSTNYQVTSFGCINNKVYNIQLQGSSSSNRYVQLHEVKNNGQIKQRQGVRPDSGYAYADTYSYNSSYNILRNYYVKYFTFPNTNTYVFGAYGRYYSASASNNFFIGYYWYIKPPSSSSGSPSLEHTSTSNYPRNYVNVGSTRTRVKNMSSYDAIGVATQGMDKFYTLTFNTSPSMSIGKETISSGQYMYDKNCQNYFKLMSRPDGTNNLIVGYTYRSNKYYIGCFYGKTSRMLFANTLNGEDPYTNGISNTKYNGMSRPYALTNNTMFSLAYNVSTSKYVIIHFKRRIVAGSGQQESYWKIGITEKEIKYQTSTRPQIRNSGSFIKVGNYIFTSELGFKLDSNNNLLQVEYYNNFNPNYIRIHQNRIISLSTSTIKLLK